MSFNPSAAEAGGPGGVEKPDPTSILMDSLFNWGDGVWGVGDGEEGGALEGFEIGGLENPEDGGSVQDDSLVGALNLGGAQAGSIEPNLWGVGDGSAGIAVGGFDAGVLERNDEISRVVDISMDSVVETEGLKVELNLGGIGVEDAEICNGTMRVDSVEEAVSGPDEKRVDMGGLEPSGVEPAAIGDGCLVSDDLVGFDVFGGMADENAVGKGDTFMADARSVSQIDENLMGKGGLGEELIPAVKTSMPEVLDQSEIQSPEFQRNQSSDLIVGDNQDTGPFGADAHGLESSLEPDNKKVQLVQKPEVEVDTEQELLGSSEKESVIPWTKHVDTNQRVQYDLPPQDTTKLSVSDLVWGKVKNHPWWPGQIFSHSDASDLALKHQRKDGFLVAYFWDGTFAWRDEAQLKPFYTDFSKMEKQSNSDAFLYAVTDAMGEVSRRMELGMTCSCLPEKESGAIKFQKNAGIKEGADYSLFDKSLVLNYFEPSRLLEYINELAQVPTGGPDWLELVIVKAQVKTFYHSKGYPELPEFTFGRGLMENDIEIPPSGEKNPTEAVVELCTPLPSESVHVKRKRGRPKKQEHILGEISASGDKKPKKKAVERPTPLSLELVSGKRKRSRPLKYCEASDYDSDSDYDELPNSKRKRSTPLSSESVRGKRKRGRPARYCEASDSDTDSADLRKNKRKRVDLLGDSEIMSASPNPRRPIGAGKLKDSVVNLDKKLAPSALSSFKVGECIRRVASQLSGSPPILKGHGETLKKSTPKSGKRGRDIDPDYTVPRNKGISGNSSSSTEELLSHLSLAASDPLKRHIFVSKVVRFFSRFRDSFASSKELIDTPLASLDTSTPDHMKDSYWSDMISDRIPGKGLLSNGLKGKEETDTTEEQREENKPIGETDTQEQKEETKPIGETDTQEKRGEERKPIGETSPSCLLDPNMEENIVDTPTVIVLTFNSPDHLPSEANIIKSFAPFGPLRESETEVLRQANRVKVVFKRRSDAETAFTSAGEFDIFGTGLASYQLDYMRSASKASPDQAPQGENEGASITNDNLEASGQAGTGVLSSSQVEAAGTG